MNVEDVITKIQTGTLKDIFPILENWQILYKEYIKLIHPDHCSIVGCADAVIKLNHLKFELENGKIISDDIAEINYTLKHITFTSKKNIFDKFLKNSLENFNILYNLKEKDSSFFKKYIPQKINLNTPSKLVIDTHYRSIPLLEVVKHFNNQVPQEHVNWILNRMLEFCCWIAQNGYVHCGINPESIFILPEEHGLLCTSFYHLTKNGQTIQTISGKYTNFYPQDIFKNKKGSKTATSRIDLECIFQTVFYLLGGSIAKLRNTYNNEFLDFYSQIHYDPSETYFQHKELLKKHFDTKKFYTLSI